MTMKHPFIYHLINTYQFHNKEPYLATDLWKFAAYLLDRNIISKPTQTHYTILSEFHTFYGRSEYSSKAQIIRVLAKQYHLHENTIKNILKDHKEKFASQSYRS